MGSHQHTLSTFVFPSSFCVEFGGGTALLRGRRHWAIAGCRRVNRWSCQYRYLRSVVLCCEPIVAQGQTTLAVTPLALDRAANWVAETERWSH